MLLKRIIAGLLGIPLLLAALYEAYAQSFGFYEEHWTIPIEKIGVRTALRWQDTAFQVVFWPILLTLFYVSYRLLKYAFNREQDSGATKRVKWSKVAIAAAISFIVGLTWFELRQYRRQIECKRRGASFTQQVESIRRDAQAQLKRGTKWADVMRFFAEHKIPFHSTKTDASGEIETYGCAPTGCGSDAALIGVRVQLDADGAVSAEPSVVALYTNCL